MLCFRLAVRTDFHPIPAVVEPRENHLAKAKDGPKGGEKADRGDTEQVDEQNGQKRIDEPEVKDGHGEYSDRETGDYHVGGKPLLTPSVISRQSTRSRSGCGR